MTPRRRTPAEPTQVGFSDEQVKQLLNAITAKSLPATPKTTPLQFKSSPHLHDVFSFTRLLTDDVDPTRVPECLQHGSMYWYESLSRAMQLGLGTRTRHWKDELEKRYRHNTAGKVSVTPQEQEEHDTQQDTQMAATPVQPKPQPVTLQQSEQRAPPSVTPMTPQKLHDTQQNTQMPSTPPQQVPQPIAM